MRKIFIAVSLCVVMCGCARKEPETEPLAAAYARLAVALGERDTDSIDYYYGPKEWVAEVRRTPPKLDEIAAAARGLRQTLPAQRDRRTDRIRRQLESIAARADMLAGASLAFDEESMALFGVRLVAPDGEALAGVRAEVRRLAPEGVDALERHYLIPADRVSAVMRQALAACRARTAEHIPLPAGESVALEFVRNKPWSAYSLYQGGFHSRIQVNTDFALTLDRALALACHEGYPGHHAMHTLQDAELVRGAKMAEWMVQPAFSPQSWASEAMASYAAEISFPGSARAEVLKDLAMTAGVNPEGMERYESVARLLDRLQVSQAVVARDFLDAKLEWARASAAMERDAMMAHSDEALKYISQFRTYVLCYTVGRERVQAAVAGADPWAKYRALMTDPDAATALGTIASVTGGRVRIR